MNKRLKLYVEIACSLLLYMVEQSRKFFSGTVNGDNVTDSIE